MKQRLISLVVLLFVMGFVQGQNWQTDFELAKAQATNESKPIVMVFQGSDWCASCIKLDREVWSTDEFKAFANNHFVMLKVDFPRKKNNSLSSDQEQKNKLLAEKYNQNGFFPLVVILDNSGTVKGQTGYKQMAVGDYVQHLMSFK